MPVSDPTVARYTLQAPGFEIFPLLATPPVLQPTRYRRKWYINRGLGD